MKELILFLFMFAAFTSRAQNGSTSTHKFYIDIYADSVKQILRNARTPGDTLYAIIADLDNLDDRSNLAHTDSLLKDLTRLNSRLNLVDVKPYVLCREADALVNNKEYSKAIEIFKQAILLFDHQKKIHGFSSVLATIRVYYSYMGLQEERLAFYQDKLKYYLENGPMENAAACYHGIAGYYYYKADYNNAINNYLKSSEIYHTFSTLGYRNETVVVGLIYNKWGNYERARQYLDNGYSLCLNSKDYNNAMLVQNELATIDKKRADYQSALNHLDEALKLYERDTLRCMNAKAISLSEKGGLLLEMKMPDKALMVLKEAKAYRNSKSLQIATIEGNIETEYYMFKYYSYIGDPINAEKELLAAYEEATEVKSEGLILKYNKELALFYHRIGKDAEATPYTLKYISKSDSLHEQQNNFNISEFERQQQARQNEEEVLGLKTQKERQRNYFIAGGIFLLLISFGILNRLLFTRKMKKQLEEKNILIEKEKLRAEQSEKFKQQFLANMSHEIRTPMNAVTGMTNLLLDQNPRTDQMNYLSGIKKSSDTLLHIINDILDLAKIEAGKIELEQIDFSIREGIEQVKQTLNHKAIEKGIQLITHINSRVTDVVIGDPVRLNQVLMNLAGNAIKFTEKGSVAIEVTPGETGTKFSVIDTGIGIPEDKLQTVFESFTQAYSSDSRKFGGTGLGLTISKQLVDQMGGTIFIESEVDSGSTFTFEIKYPAGSAERMQIQKSAEQIDGSILNGLKILLTDDNEHNRIVTRDTLQSKAKVEIIEAVNGKEAIEILAQEDFDIILMDVQMPIMDGYEATHYIREKLSGPKNQIPIIALTASVIRSDLDRCRQAGMTDYVPKPFKTFQLISAIAKATGRDIKFIDQQNVQEKKKPEINSLLVDLSYLEEFCEGDEARMKKYINMMLQSVPLFVEKINGALSENNFEEIASQLHGFKMKWIMMGMEEAKELAQWIEQECRKETTDHALLKEHLSQLLSLVQSAMKELAIPRRA